MKTIFILESAFKLLRQVHNANLMYFLFVQRIFACIVHAAKTKVLHDMQRLKQKVFLEFLFLILFYLSIYLSISFSLSLSLFPFLSFPLGLSLPLSLSPSLDISLSLFLAQFLNSKLWICRSPNVLCLRSSQLMPTTSLIPSFLAQCRQLVVYVFLRPQLSCRLQV